MKMTMGKMMIMMMMMMMIIIILIKRTAIETVSCKKLEVMF
jgi:hypothetical protein